MTKINTDLVGQKFGMLTVIKQVPKPPIRKSQQRYWLCKCDCGSDKDIIASTSDLNSKHITSCGCIIKEKLSKFVTEKNHTEKGRGKKNKITKFYEDEQCAYGYTSNTNHIFYVDKEDVCKIDKFTWHENDQGYIMSRINGKLIRLHRFIMECPKNMEVDHKNHQKFDNRKSNLRIVTRSQNNMNKKTQGVCWIKERNKWKAYIGINNKHKHLGYFDTYEQARNARLEAETNLFNDFSYINSMDGDDSGSSKT